MPIYIKIHQTPVLLYINWKASVKCITEKVILGVISCYDNPHNFGYVWFSKNSRNTIVVAHFQKVLDEILSKNYDSSCQTHG